MFLSVVILGRFTTETHAMALYVSIDTPPLLHHIRGRNPVVVDVTAVEAAPTACHHIFDRLGHHTPPFAAIFGQRRRYLTIAALRGMLITHRGLWCRMPQARHEFGQAGTGSRSQRGTAMPQVMPPQVAATSVSRTRVFAGAR